MIRDNCKNILCFGDSNTFGSNPSGGRWDRTKRWPGRLQQLLGEDYYVKKAAADGRLRLTTRSNWIKTVVGLYPSHWPRISRWIW